MATDDQNNKAHTQSVPPLPSASKVSGKIGISGGYSGTPPKIPYPNPPEISNPDAATLREQWRFAIKQYSRWYSHAWGTAILAGLSFFALGWMIKGSNPLPSFGRSDNKNRSSSSRDAKLRQSQSRSS